jgi:hypothetical protein
VVDDIALDATAGPKEAAAGAGPHVRRDPAGHGHRDQDRLLDDHGETLTPLGGGNGGYGRAPIRLLTATAS